MKAKRRVEPAQAKISVVGDAPDWRAKALELLPELSEELAAAFDPMQFWSDVEYAFEEAYAPPIDADRIRRIYAFADWCLLNSDDSKEAENHLLTCVALCFYEEIPQCPAARADMPNWFTRP